MNKLALLVLALSLVACAPKTKTIIVTQCPVPPSALMVQPEELKTIPKEPS